MIALRRQRGAPVTLRLTLAFALADVSVAAAIRDDLGNVWPFGVRLDAQARIVELDAGVDARILPAGRLYFDIRFTRNDIVVHTITVLLVLLDDLSADDAALVERTALRQRAALEGRVYLTVEGDVLDAICARELGSDALAPRVLNAQPRLADLGPILPDGVAILLPSDLNVPAAPARITLWGRA
ncbi:MAG: tail protein X [Roseinatronobacter sp.]